MCRKGSRGQAWLELLEVTPTGLKFTLVGVKGWICEVLACVSLQHTSICIEDGTGSRTDQTIVFADVSLGQCVCWNEQDSPLAGVHKNQVWGYPVRILGILLN